MVPFWKPEEKTKKKEEGLSPGSLRTPQHHSGPVPDPGLVTDQPSDPQRWRSRPVSVFFLDVMKGATETGLVVVMN